MATKATYTPMNTNQKAELMSANLPVYNQSDDISSNNAILEEELKNLQVKRAQIQKELDDLKIKRNQFDELQVETPELTGEDKENIQAQQFRAGAEAMMEYDPATAQSWLLRADEIEARRQAKATSTSPSAIRQQLRMARDRAYESYKNDKLDDNVREISRQEMLLLTTEMAKPYPNDTEVYAKIDKLYAESGLGAGGAKTPTNATAGAVTPMDNLYDDLSAEIASTIGNIKYKGTNLDNAKNALLQKINASGLGSGYIDKLKTELDSRVADKGNAPKSTDYEGIALGKLEKIPATTMGSKISGLSTSRELLDNANTEANTYRTSQNQSAKDQAANAMLTILGRLVAGGVLSDGEFDTAKATAGADAAVQTIKNTLGWVGKNVTTEQAKAVMERLNTYIKKFNTGRINTINKFLDYVDPEKKARTKTVQTRVEAMVPDPVISVITISGAGAGAGAGAKPATNTKSASGTPQDLKSFLGGNK